MSRYAQRRRRGGSPPTAAAVAPINLTSVSLFDASTATLFFDGPAPCNGATDFSFSINGFTIASSSQDGPNSVTVTAAGPVWNPGDPYSLIASPTWLDVPVNFPASGLVT